MPTRRWAPIAAVSLAALLAPATASAAFPPPTVFPERDWKAVVRRSLLNAGRADLLAAEYDKAGPRIAQTEWEVAAGTAPVAARPAGSVTPS